MLVYKGTKGRAGLKADQLLIVTTLFTYNAVVLAVEGGEVAEEVTDGDDELQELIEDEGHELLAAGSDVLLLEWLPDTVGRVQIDEEVDADEDAGGGQGGHGAHHSGDEEDVELTDQVGRHQVHRGDTLARCLPS